MDAKIVTDLLFHPAFFYYSEHIQNSQYSVSTRVESTPKLMILIPELEGLYFVRYLKAKYANTRCLKLELTEH